MSVKSEMKKPSTEYLSSDLFDESHLKMFAPFRFWQMIFGSCRVHAKDRFVTAPTRSQKIYTVTCVLLALLLHMSTIYFHISSICKYQNIYFLSVLSVILNFMMYTCNIIHVRFINNENNVKFYIKTQQIDRKLNINNSNPMNHLIYKGNIWTIVFIFVVFSMLVLVALVEDKIVFAMYFGLCYCQLTSTMEWVFCSNVIIYFYIRLRYINAIITNHLKGVPNKGDMSKFTPGSRKYMRCLAADVHDFKFSETDDYLKDIFEELFRFQDLYRWQVFLFCLKFVSMTLISFEFGLLALQNNMLRWLECVILPAATTIDLMLVIVICVRCEAFSAEIKDIKRLSTTILSIYLEGPLRDKAMKMLKMIKEKPPHVSVYDMWNMDASTMLNMINIVTTLMVTLLQFALL